MSASKKVVSKSTQKRLAVQNPTAPTPLDMLNRAMDKGVDAEQLDKFITLHERWESNEARKAFHVALSEFKKTDLTILKDKVNTQYGSQYTSIGNFVNAVNRAMAPFGLNASWDFDQGDNIAVTCILSHELGHTRSVTMHGPPDESGSKNKLQQIKSTVTYLEVSTFQAVTGVVAEDASLDDDGNAADKTKPVINAKQVKQLTKLLKDLGRDMAGFLEWAKVEKIEQISVENFNFIVPKLKKAIKEQEAKPA